MSICSNGTQIIFLIYTVCFSFQVEKIEEFEPGRYSYYDKLLKIKECQARVFFLYARYVINEASRGLVVQRQLQL